MIGFLRAIVIWAVVGAVAYFILRIYARSLRREALEKEWDSAPQCDAESREEFIDKGMAEY